MACQLNFPNMSVLPSCQRRHGAGCGSWHGRWSLTGRQLLPHDVLEQTGLHGSVGVGTYVLGLPEELAVCGLIQHRTGDLRGSRPLRELLGRHGVDVECHAGETVATEMCRESWVHPGAVGLEVEPGPHAVHGIDHA